MATKSEIVKSLGSEIESLRKEIKDLKSDNKRLKLSNAAYSNNSKANASMIETAKKLLGVKENEAWLQTLKKVLSSEERMDYNSLHVKLNKRNNEMLVLRRLLGISSSPIIETKDALVELINTKESLEQKLKDTKTAVEADMKTVFEISEVLSGRCTTVNLKDILEKVKELKQSATPINPFYIKVCTAMRITPGINPDVLVEKIEQLIKGDKISLSFWKQTLCEYLEIKLDCNMMDILGKINSLKDDLTAARDQEDKNALEVTRLKKLNLGLQAEVNEYKTKYSFKVATDAFENFNKSINRHIQFINRGKRNTEDSDFKRIDEIVAEILSYAKPKKYNLVKVTEKNTATGDEKIIYDSEENAKLTKLEKELIELNEKFIQNCNELISENVQLKHELNNVVSINLRKNIFSNSDRGHIHFTFLH